MWSVLVAGGRVEVGWWLGDEEEQGEHAGAEDGEVLDDVEVGELARCDAGGNSDRLFHLVDGDLGRRQRQARERAPANHNASPCCRH